MERNVDRGGTFWSGQFASRKAILISARSHLCNRRRSNSRTNLCFYARLSIALNPLTAFKLLYISLSVLGIFLPVRVCRASSPKSLAHSLPLVPRNLHPRIIEEIVPPISLTLN